jgi:hypothetical protein
MKKALLTIVALAAPRAALACPVCFGQSDAPMASATNMGILMMLGVVAVVLGSFATFFIYLNRRARLTEMDALRLAEPMGPAGAGHYTGIDPQKGTA